MVSGSARPDPDRSTIIAIAAGARTVPDLAELLRALRRRYARQRLDSELTYREVAAQTGWSASTIAEYFTGKTLPPTDKFDALVGLLGATPAERGALATARDRVAEHKRSARAAPTHPPHQPLPRQLPVVTRDFVGRVTELAELSALVRQTPASGAVLIFALSGIPGVGKTALAVHFAHRMAERFPDGQLYVDLRGFDPSGAVMPSESAMRGFLAALGVPPRQVPADLPARSALYRSLLANRRMLIVLDNARDAQQVRPLLPGSAGCVVLVTSRNELTGLVATAGARSLRLEALTADEGHELLVRRLGADRVTAEPAAVEQILARCAGLPLALAVVAARAAARPGFRLAAIADQLQAGQPREADTVLDVLAESDPATDLRGVFSWSYQALTPAAARLFRLLGLHCGPDITAAAAASLAGTAEAEAEALLAGLVRVNLLAEHLPGRYVAHDLLRSYATGLAHAHDSEQQRHEALTRTLTHYTLTAQTADLMLRPNGALLGLSLVPPATAAHPEGFDDHQQAMAWFNAERAVLLAALRQALDTGFDAHACELAWALDTFLDRQGHWLDRAAVCDAALRAARRLGNTAAQAIAHRFVAGTHIVFGQYAEAHAHLSSALDLYGKLGAIEGRAQTHQNIAILWDRQDRPDNALAHAKQALILYRRAGHRRGHADALNAVGWCYARLDEHSQALAYCRQAITLLQELDDRAGEAATWDSLGYAHHHLGEYDEAINCYQRSLSMTRDLGALYDEADVLGHLGDTHHDAGNQAEAYAAWQHALDILQELRHPDAEDVRAKLTACGQPPHRRASTLPSTPPVRSH